ncbi:MAG TPA: prepilin-type N-terminal cleavage/methylation domain-containing protein [Myxococcota bacterium]|nr:prepilin-type N-terminal cleavage/methylation domain-containing protein [Myxococcota bacterium]
MLSHLKRREGFTLIELMIVVAIIGILAAIAIPNFIKFQLRSKAGESKVNLAAIRTAEESYFAEAGTYMDMPATPAAFVPGLKTQFLPVCPNPLPVWTPGAQGNCWIGWQPEGDVYYAYQIGAGRLGAIVAVDPTVVGAPITANQFYAGAVADIDADAVLNSWGVNQPDNTGAFTAPPGWTAGTVCGASVPGTAGPNGPLDTGTGLSVLGQVGPCDSIDMGRNVF